jgi:alpha-tubulin suppressor-like RCC1 family protein
MRHVIFSLVGSLVMCACGSSAGNSPPADVPQLRDLSVDVPDVDAPRCDGGTMGCISDGGATCCESVAARLALGNTHSCMLTATGTAQCWGENIAGELGNGAASPLRNELTPVGVVDLVNATDLAAARSSTCAIRVGGSVVCWGHNDSGQLGTGTASSMWTSHFVSAVGITNGRQITAGWDHVCVATTTDTVLCWGLNLDGRLGDGTTTNRASPAAVVGLANVAQVEAGPMHTCAVHRDGTVACWGFGSTGRLGTGTYDDQLRPAAVAGVSNATAVACSRFATCVLRADATVACTGGNDNGELGDGTTTRRPTMAPVPGLTDVVRLAMGDEHACVVRRDGSVWCWGRNRGGQLGDGTTATRLAPTRVPGITGALQLDLGGDHTCALLAGGRITCWGTNSAGQLGDGTTANRSAPVPVLLP